MDRLRQLARVSLNAALAPRQARVSHARVSHRSGSATTTRTASLPRRGFVARAFSLSAFSLSAFSFYAVSFTVLLAGCTETPVADEAPRAAATAWQVVGQPLDESRLTACLKLLASLPEERRPAFSPAVEPLDPEGLTGKQLIDAHRNRYQAALDFAPHAAPWKADPQIATAIDRAGLEPVELAALLTQISCAYQVSTLPDLRELQADASINLMRMAGRWDAGAADPSIVGGELDRRHLADAIAELVALDSYLSLLAAVPEDNAWLVRRHEAELTAFLPTTHLREQLETIVELP